MRKQKLFGVISLLLAAMLVFAGCGGKGEESSVTTQDGDYTPTKDLKITIWNTQGTDYTRTPTLPTNILSDWVEENTRVYIDNIYGNDGGQWDTKLYRLIAGDNLPEVIACSSGQGPAHFAKLAEADKIWPLTEEMLEKYAPNVLKRIPADMLERFKIDGVLYGIPYGFNSNETTQPDMTAEELELVQEYCIETPCDETACIWIRDDIAQMLYPEAKSWDEICKMIEETQEPVGDELFDIPINTTQEYIDLFYKIQDLNLTENGKPVYAFGYDGGDNWTGLCYLGGDMMGYATHYYTASWNPETEEMRVPLTEPIVREAAKIQNQMVIDKVIDPESLVHTNNMYKEKVLNGQYAVAALGTAGGAEQVNQQLEKAGKSYRYRPLYSSVPNQPEYAAGKQPELWISSMGFLKTLSEDELIQILNWVNLCLSDEFEEVYWWGTKEAGMYTEDENGIRTYTDDRFTQRFLYGDSSALPSEECMGIGRMSDVGLLYPTAINISQSRWSPVVMHKSFHLTPYNYSFKGLKFKKDSKHVTELKSFPSGEIWSPGFSEIPEVVSFWGNREQWENPFKIAVSAETPERFDEKWDEALANLARIVDVDEMSKKMTEVAKAELATMKQAE